MPRCSAAAAGVVDVLAGAAGALAVARRAVVVELQRDADHVEALPLQEARRPRRNRRRPTWRRRRASRGGLWEDRGRSSHGSAAAGPEASRLHGPSIAGLRPAFQGGGFRCREGGKTRVGTRPDRRPFWWRPRGGARDPVPPASPDLHAGPAGRARIDGASGSRCGRRPGRSCRAHGSFDRVGAPRWRGNSNTVSILRLRRDGARLAPETARGALYGERYGGSVGCHRMDPVRAHRARGAFELGGGGRGRRSGTRRPPPPSSNAPRARCAQTGSMR